MAHVSSRPHQAASIVDRIATWFLGCARTLVEIRARAALARKLEGVDDHLLRDMGLTWTGKRFERTFPDDSR